MSVPKLIGSAMLGFFAFSSSASPIYPLYSVVRPSDFAYSDVRGLSESGLITGVRNPFSSNPTTYRPYLADSTTAMDIAPQGSDFLAESVNSAGEVAGRKFDPVTGHTEAFRYSNGSLELLNLGNVVSSSAASINDRGEIAGEFTTETGASAFVWSQASIVRELQFPSNSGRFTPFSINEVGDVFGMFREGAEIPTTKIWKSDGTIIDLGFQPVIGAGEILDSGTVISSRFDGSSTRAFQFGSAGLVDLPTLGGDRSFGMGGNEAGLIVGSSETSNNQFTHAFIYSPDFGFVDLNRLILPVDDFFSDIRLFWAVDVNELGLIAAYGVSRDSDTVQSFILRPTSTSETLPELPDLPDPNNLNTIPEPASTALLLIGLAAFGIGGIRRSDRVILG